MRHSRRERWAKAAAEGYFDFHAKAGTKPEYLDVETLRRLILRSIPAEAQDAQMKLKADEPGIPSWLAPIAHINWAGGEVGSERAEAVDAVILTPNESGDLSVVAIRRQTGELALPGGFRNPAFLKKRIISTNGQLEPESPAETVAREASEEIGITPRVSREMEVDRLAYVDLFDHPDRDPRGPISSFAFAGIFFSRETKPLRIKAGDDAKSASLVPIDEFFHADDVFSDHQHILYESLVKVNSLVRRAMNTDLQFSEQSRRWNLDRVIRNYRNDFGSIVTGEAGKASGDRGL